MLKKSQFLSKIALTKNKTNKTHRISLTVSCKIHNMGSNTYKMQIIGFYSAPPAVRQADRIARFPGALHAP